MYVRNDKYVHKSQTSNARISGITPKIQIIGVVYERRGGVGGGELYFQIRSTCALGPRTSTRTPPQKVEPSGLSHFR